MKKVSIAAVKQKRNISQQKLTIRLDLGDRNSWYCGFGPIESNRKMSVVEMLHQIYGFGRTSTLIRWVCSFAGCE